MGNASLVKKTPPLEQSLAFGCLLQFSNGEQGLFKVEKPRDRRIGGLNYVGQNFSFDIGNKRISQGSLGNCRARGAAYSFRMEVDRSDCGRPDPKGIGFSLEIKFDAPSRSTVKISNLGEIEVVGNLTVKSLNNAPKLNAVVYDGSHVPYVEPVVQGALLSLDEYLIDARKTVLREDVKTPIVDFSNTIVSLWRHVPEMVESMTRSVSDKISKLKLPAGGILNVLAECVTEDPASKAALSLALSSESVAHISLEDVKDFDNLSQDLIDDDFFALLRSELRAVAAKLGIGVQFHLIDVDESVENFKILNENWERSRGGLSRLLIRSSSSGAALLSEIHQAVNTQLETSMCFNRFRETEMVKQIQKWGLGINDNAVNLLVVGAAHAPILKHLPKAHPVVTLWPDSEVFSLPPAAQKILTRFNTISNQAEVEYEKKGRVGPIRSLRFALHELIGRSPSWRDRYGSPLRGLCLRELTVEYVAGKLSGDGLTRIFTSLGNLPESATGRERLACIESATLEEFGLKNKRGEFGKILGRFVLDRLKS